MMIWIVIFCFWVWYSLSLQISRPQLLREVLTLTKMNWNSARMYGLMPITVRFSRLVGDILREVPEDVVPQPKYKFYV